MALHPKIKELKQRAMPVNESSLSVDAKGELIDDRRIKGYLVVWGVRDDHGTVFLKGCCAKSIKERGPESNSKYRIKFLWQHRQDDPLCNFDVLKEDDYGLYFEAVPDDVPNGDRAVRQVKSGTLNQFSIGFDYVWDKTEWDDNLDAIVLKEIDLFEGSVVTIPSNMETYAVRSMEQYENENELLQDDTEDFIKSLPRAKQLEARQLIARQISLARIEPQALRQSALGSREPVEAGIDYDYLLTNFKI